MDATRLRGLIDDAIGAQTAYDSAEDNLKAATELRDKMREKHRVQLGNLKSAVAEGTVVIYGDKVIRVGNDGNGIRLFILPVVSVPVLAPPPAPLPEAKTEPPPKAAPPKAAPPLAGGKVPTLGDKKS